MVDIARPASVKRQKKIRRAVYAAVGLLVIVLITVGVSRLKPAAPGVDRATVWIDTVKRGDMTRQVRGSGTLIPEDIRWIAATTQGRVERIVLRPGAIVKPDTVILELSNPDLLQSVMEAKLAWASAQANFANRKAELESEPADSGVRLWRTSKRSTRTRRLTLQADEQLFKDGLVSELQLKRSRAAADELKNRLSIEQKRMEITRATTQSQLAPQAAEVDQRKAAYELRVSQLEDLKVKARMEGVLQVVPVEVGAQVSPGTNLCRVANPTNLKAELRIAETQTKDITNRPGGGSGYPQRRRPGPRLADRPGGDERHRGCRHHPRRPAAARRAARPERGRHDPPGAADEHHSRGATGIRAGREHDQPLQASAERRSSPHDDQAWTQLGQHD